MLFADQVIALIETLDTSRKHYRLYEQLVASVTSIPMDIAEGQGREEVIRFLYISRGSLYETLTLLEIFKLRKWISAVQFDELDSRSNEIARMINGLIKSVANKI